MRHPDPGKEHAQVVVDLRHRPHRRARILRGGLLLDRDGGREALDGVDVGLLHLLEELPRIGGEGLDVATLPLGVDGVEGEGGLTRAREPRQDHELVAGNLEIDGLEVVLARAADDYPVIGHGRPILARAGAAGEPEHERPGRGGDDDGKGQDEAGPAVACPCPRP